MVRLRPNEVVDDRVLLARAQAEIVHLKQLLRQALDNTLNVPGDMPRWGSGEWNASEAGPHTKSAEACLKASEDSVTVEDRSSKGSGEVTTEKLGEKAADITSTMAEERERSALIAENERLREDNECLKADVQRLLYAQQQKRHRRKRGIIEGPPPSPMGSSARYAYAADTARRNRLASRSSGSLRSFNVRSPSISTQTRSKNPAFQRRKFEDEVENISVGSGELEFADLSAEQVEDILGKEGELEEDMQNSTQLEHFRAKLKQLDKRDSNHARWESKKKGAEMESLQDHQRLEDLMFDAQSEQMETLREQRGCLAAARKERLALEAELEALSSASATVVQAQSESTRLVSEYPENDQVIVTNGSMDSEDQGNHDPIEPINSPHTSETATPDPPGDRHSADAERCQTASPSKLSRSIPWSVTSVRGFSPKRQMGWTTPPRRSPIRRRPRTNTGGEDIARPRLNRKAKHLRSPLRDRLKHDKIVSRTWNRPDWRRRAKSPALLDSDDDGIAGLEMRVSAGTRGSKTDCSTLKATDSARISLPMPSQGKNMRERSSGSTSLDIEIEDGVQSHLAGHTPTRSRPAKERLAYGMADLGLRITVSHRYPCITCCRGGGG